MLETSAFMRLAKSYESVQHNNIGGKSNMFLTTLQLNQIVEKCRTIIETYITDVDDSDSNDLDTVAALYKAEVSKNFFLSREIAL